MRKTLIMAVAALLVATPALADEWDFVLTNSTTKAIKLIEVSPAGTTTWQKNKIEEGQKAIDLTPGKRGTIHFDKGPGCKYDVRATFEDDTTLVWTGINVCDNSYVTLKISPAGAPTFTAN